MVIRTVTVVMVAVVGGGSGGTRRVCDISFVYLAFSLLFVSISLLYSFVVRVLIGLLHLVGVEVYCLLRIPSEALCRRSS